MSRRQFLKETADYTKWRISNNLPVHISLFDVDKHIRDKWISENRHDELISYILNEWDNGDFNTHTDFIEGYEQQLLKSNLPEPFKKLWTGILKIRINDWWYYKKQSLKETSYEKIELEKRQFIFEGIERYIDGLLELRQTDEIKQTLQFLKEIEAQKKPKIHYR